MVADALDDERRTEIEQRLCEVSFPGIREVGWHHATLTAIASPLVAECWANLECRVLDTRLVNRYNFFVLEVVKAWIDPAVKDPRTVHHRGRGVFMVAGDSIRLPSRAK